MNLAVNDLQTRFGRLQAVLRQPMPLAQNAVTAALAFAREAQHAGQVPLAIEVLEMLVGRVPASARAWQQLGFAYGQEQRIPEACRAFAQAVQADPLDAVSAFAHAQASLDAGFPAAQLFTQAQRLAPADLATVNGRAASLASEGDPQSAQALLENALHATPGWLAGHQYLTALRFTHGDTLDCTRSYADACAVQPQNVPLRLAWFGALAQARAWQKAQQVIADGERALGDLPAFAAARAIIAGESGELELADRLFAATASQQDAALCIAHVRHCLRTGQIEHAERRALAGGATPVAPGLWPYLALIWRLRGDARAHWLEGNPPCIRAFDLDFTAGELEQLASVLRRLHTMRAPFVEQSVRGGTQTDTNRQLFFRAEPEIQQARAKVCAAIREYVAGLPGYVPGHPLLGVPRGRILFAGSWSVRLTARGFHAAHTHPMGWISSALYVSLPQHPGPEPAGWISFGAPPPVLRLGLPAYARVEPKAGRLILFPSTLWHETLPFADGERLGIAFDVMPARL